MAWQELSEKAPQLPQDIRWHFIGHLQSNKAKAVIGTSEHCQKCSAFCRLHHTCWTLFCFFPVMCIRSVSRKCTTRTYVLSYQICHYACFTQAFTADLHWHDPLFRALMLFSAVSHFLCNTPCFCVNLAFCLLDCCCMEIPDSVELHSVY